MAPVRPLMVLLAAGLVAGCQPSAKSAPPAASVAPPTPPAPAPAPAAPARKPKMICRDSQTGASARCGSPNAVLVGIETS